MGQQHGTTVRSSRPRTWQLWWAPLTPRSITKEARVLIHENEAETATYRGAWRGVAARAAIGVMCPPSVLAATPAGGATGADLGHLVRGTPRPEKNGFGGFLGRGETGLVTVGASKVQDAIRHDVTGAEKQTAKKLGFDRRGFDRALRKTVKEM